MPLPQERIYTVEDIYGLPDGKRAELIDVCIYDLANDDVNEYSFADKVESVVFQGFGIEIEKTI